MCHRLPLVSQCFSLSISNVMRAGRQKKTHESQALVTSFSYLLFIVCLLLCLHSVQRSNLLPNIGMASCRLLRQLLLHLPTFSFLPPYTHTLIIYISTPQFHYSVYKVRLNAIFFLQVSLMHPPPLLLPHQKKLCVCVCQWTLQVSC